MGGWAPFPADGWPETVELLIASGKTWPIGAAVHDLRWHVDQRVALPGRRELARRWRWTDWEVRELLADTAAWWDTATKGSPPASRADLEARIPVAKRTPSRTPPTPLPDASRTATEEPAQSGDNLPDGSRTPPTPLHTRDGDPPSPSHENNTPPPPAGGVRARTRWVAEVAEGTLGQLDPDAAELLAARWADPDQAEVDRLAVKMRGDRRRGPDGRPRVSPMVGVPEGLRRREIAEGVVEAVRRWRARQQAAPDPAAEEAAAEPPTA